jgi:hypothetical protein
MDKHHQTAKQNEQVNARGAEAPAAIEGIKPAVGLGGKLENADTVKTELQAKHPMIRVIDVRG